MNLIFLILNYLKLKIFFLVISKNISAYDYLCYKALHLFFKGWQNENLTKTDASLQLAKIVYNKGLYKAQQIRNWAKYWVENRSLPKSLQGCHQKIKSLIDDEDKVYLTFE